MKFLGMLVLAAILAVGFTQPVFASWYDRKESHEHGSMKEGHHSHSDKEKMKGVAIGGFCPVCIVHGKYMKGSANFITTYKGKKYYFVGMKQQKAFLENPKAFVPGLEKKFKVLKKEQKGNMKDKS